MEAIRAIFNAITNGSGSLTGILLVVAGFMEKVLGCSAPEADPLGATCVAPSWLAEILPPSVLIYAAMIFGLITIIGKIMRSPSGTKLRSLFAPTAVVVPPAKAGPGTVTPAQVASH